ncbi:hypothetical protein GYH30_056094 [Glycine max]|nr:hypothetical protein GYH30_056094 [Glycine max]
MRGVDVDKAGVEVSRGGEANCEVDGPKAEDEVVGAEAMMGNTREVGEQVESMTTDLILPRGSHFFY